MTQARDWHLYDWAERHAACVALMKSRQPEIVMLGDSITHFWGGDPERRGRSLDAGPASSSGIASSRAAAS